MGVFDTYGMSEAEAREFLERELARSAAATSFYWESDELEEAVDALVDALAKLIAANNRAVTRAVKERAFEDIKVPAHLRF